MKIYLAAPFKDRAIMQAAYADTIEAKGHTITHKWWNTEDVAEAVRTDLFNRERASEDVQGVLDCDLMILINSAKSEGKALEQGIAIAEGKPIIAIGKRGEHSQNVFHYLSNYIWVDDLFQALTTLNIVAWLLKEQA